MGVKKLCEILGEGTGHSGEYTGSAKDEGLDVVAWRDFLIVLTEN